MSSQPTQSGGTDSQPNPQPPSRHLAIVTAGGAGMFCGSCLHDNEWARGLMRRGVEVSLIPTYTPIRTDHQNVSEQKVFLGGLNVYLNNRFRWWHSVPHGLRNWLDRPGLLNFVTRWTTGTDAADLGDLTLALLRGGGPQAEATDQLVQHIVQLAPDAVIFSNALLSGVVPSLRAAYRGPIYCVLQGDDFFLDGLPITHRQRAIEQTSQNAAMFDRLLVHSRFYRDHMAAYLSLPTDKFWQIPLSLETSLHTGKPKQEKSSPLTIGYFARIAPEKGLHHLVDAYVLLRQRRQDVQLRIGGWLGSQHAKYFAKLRQQLDRVGAWEYTGSPDTIEEKVAFLSSCDLFCVPTEFLEPKGLYLLEALANGVPVIAPNHGAFPERVAETEGGLLVPPRDPVALANAIEQLMDDHELRHSLGARGQENVRRYHSLEAAAEETLRQFFPAH